jgi:ketosteroid isomerase-like protein
VKKALYANSQEAEAAFYDAFGKNDLEAMMAVWADDDDIYCVHPGGQRIAGMENVRESWRRVFGSGQTLSFQLRARHEIHGMMLAIHSVYARSPMLATNIYMRTDQGWRMVAHHASPAPALPAAQSTAESDVRRAPKMLH